MLFVVTGSLQQHAQSHTTVLLSCMLVAYRQEGEEPMSQEQVDRLNSQLPAMMLFAITWSLGATCETAGRTEFDLFLRSKAGGGRSH